MELPVKFKCKTVKETPTFYLGAPHFGHCIEGVVDNQYVGQTIKYQERLLKNLKFFTKTNK